MYTFVLFLFLFVNVNCLFVHENIDSWPTNPQAKIIARPQTRRIFANSGYLRYQIPRKNTVVVVPNSGQIPVARSNPYVYGANTISRTPTTVIVTQPVEY